jgi:hypothetical protein
VARENFERDQVEDEIRRAMSSVDRVQRYLEGDLLAGPYEHPAAGDALHALDQASEQLDAAGRALGFDVDDLRRARL